MTRSAPEIVLVSGYVIELDSTFIRTLLSSHRFQLFMLGAFLLLIERLPFPLIGVERWQAFSLMAVVA